MNSLVIAGLAITQAIRIEDAVIIENEWGRVEDIAFEDAPHVQVMPEAEPQGSPR
jgi:hypothetical protein